MKKINQWINHLSPFGYFCFLIVTVSLANMMVNLFKGRQIFDNIDIAFYGIAPLILGGIVSLIKVKKVWQFLIALFTTFLGITIQMIVEGSYVDYTSLIIGFILSVFASGVALLVVWGFEIRQN